jgi:two-component sensor histidine kinase
MGEGAHRFIYVNSSLQGAFLLLEVKNSCGVSKEIQWGTGLANIRAVAEKYQGAMEIRTEDGVFVLTVLMNMGD